MDNKFVAIIDYGMGNVGSVKNALDYLKIQSKISCDPKEIASATHLILPGVGAFQEGMKKLKAKNLIKILEKEVLENKKPFLGICLGMQMLSEIGDEDGKHKGMGWIKGRTRRFKINEKKFHLPHVGWNDVFLKNRLTLFNKIGTKVFYFVHSYILEPADQSVIAASCNYGERFCASIEKDNIFGVQFHPERSQKSGLKLLENFLTFSN